MDVIPATLPARESLPAARFRALGTEVRVLVTDPAHLRDVEEHTRRRFEEIDRTFSRFRSDSELTRLDWLPGVRQSASPLFLTLLELALRAARDTDGWFDPSVRDAVEAAGYDRSIERLGADGPGPERPALSAGQWDRVTFDRDRGWVCVPEGVRLDFGGIGKGFAVDEALRSLPVPGGGVLVDAGGDLGVSGTAPAGGWRIAVTADDGGPEGMVSLHAGAIATSGLGRRTWVRAGERLHHLIDPHTGRPGGGRWRIVTVAARDCAAAEVAAKCAWLMGGDGPDWIADLGLAGRFLSRDGSVLEVGSWPRPHDEGAPSS